jgi:hypothetical protein
MGGWRRWFGREMIECKKYFDLRDTSQTRPPNIVLAAGGILFLIFVLWCMG